jgi:DNA-binding CsgD family transcriptional regulator
MSIWQRFLHLIGKRPKPKSSPRTFEFSESLQVTLSKLAQHEGRPEHEFTSDLVAAGLKQYLLRENLKPKWRSLTPREKDVARLIHKGLTNDQIAKRLSLSPETIKTHVANVLLKFGVKRKSDLRHMLDVLNLFHYI